MNQNRPFYSTNTNLYDQFFRSSAPTNLNGENVILSQEQQRRIYETLNTSIMGNQFGQAGNQTVLFAQKQLFPEGVLFTFPPSQMVSASHGGCCKCPLPTQTQPPCCTDFNYLNQPSAINAFFPSSMEYQPLKEGGLRCQQPQSKEPFKLVFHHDHGSSCSDLLDHFSQIPASKALPDLSNINGVFQQQQDCLKSCQTCPESNARKLTLSKPVNAPQGHVVDMLEENKKKVSFSDTSSPMTEDKSSQSTGDCICDAKKCKSKSKKQKPKKNKKPKTPSNTSSETTLSSDSEDVDEPQKPKKKRWWNRTKEMDCELCDKLSCDSEDGRDVMKCKKCSENKRKKKEDSEDVSGSDSVTDDTSSNLPQEDCPK